MEDINNDVGMYIISYFNSGHFKIGVTGNRKDYGDKTNVIKYLYKRYNTGMPIQKIYFFPSYLSYKDTEALEKSFHNKFKDYRIKSNEVYKIEHFDVLYKEICNSLQTMADEFTF